MKKSLSENIRSTRAAKGLSQQQLADSLSVVRSTVASWEIGRRIPDVDMIARIAATLEVPVMTLIGNEESNSEKPVVILVDDEKIILNGGIPILEQVMPNAEIVGFSKPSDAIEYARQTPVSIAFLDIEMGRISGLKLCEALLKINPCTNVIFLTAYTEYSLDAWKTGASGFIKKPLSASDVRVQLSLLRYPVGGLQS